LLDGPVRRTGAIQYHSVRECHPTHIQKPCEISKCSPILNRIHTSQKFEK
jgi:hypothetical protein